MTRNLASLLVVALTLVAVTTFVAVAQDKPADKPVTAQPAPAPAGKDVTMVGKLIDLPCFMMGAGKPDAAKCGDAMKAGVPVALETPTGVILLGKGAKGMAEFVAMAHEEVEVKGKLFEKGGVKYIDVVALAKKGAETKKEEPKKVEPAKVEPKKEEPKKVEPAKVEPKKEEPKKVEPAKVEPKKEEPKKVEPAKTEPKKEEPKKEEPKKEQPKNK
jgi:hypothetical protein